ncbi:MAG: RdgB/HAM1 family non-canonical purine NTP pyrophosphatase [Hyphomicrobiaceae bacterium]|nr:RdgB/HAM1 family non-canonical purine NTP pyrophosphatase [Hyphomicrobiaceae bacterium]
MTRRLTRGTKLVVASHNPGKVWEINQLIAPFGLAAVSAGELGLAEPEETETTFAGNALLKARAASEGSGLPALADDSGLEVDALGGAPSIYSARWAGSSKDFTVAMLRLHDELASQGAWHGPAPRANFISVLCVAWPDGEHRLFEGRVDGHLVWPARGGNGFGYDPMFVADGAQQTFGEMEPKDKYAVSHRTRAFAAFKRDCLEEADDASGDGPNAVRDAAGFAAAAANISSKAELVTFVENLRADLIAKPAEWENASLDRYLNALHSWIADTTALDGDEPKWRSLAKALLAAKSYE